jgi:hypothetical protein
MKGKKPYTQLHVTFLSYIIRLTFTRMDKTKKQTNNDEQE